MQQGSKRGRQWTFTVGVVVCIATAAIVLGGTRLATIVAVASLVVTILNGLLSRGSTNGSEDWLLTTLKRCLNVGAFLKTATVTIWFCTLVLGAYDAMRAYNAAQPFTG
jgi:hypothetical protein